MLSFQRILRGVGMLAIIATSKGAFATPKVRVVMTVDWEGRELLAKNLDAMRSLRADYPDLPILHYLNAAYFTKPDADPVKTRELIQSVLLPIDQRGLHIHAWKTLITGAGVAFRRSPGLATGDQPLSDAECQYDCGHAVPISAYTSSEMAKVVRFSQSILAQQGFGKPIYFRSGAWMLSQDVAEALTANGIISDSSAVPGSFLQPAWGAYPLYQRVMALWPNINSESQPFVISTQSGPLLEVPDNGCLADYMTAEQMLQVVHDNLVNAQSDGKIRTVVIGFHQETAMTYLPHIRGLLEGVAKLSAEGADIEFVAMPAFLTPS